MDGIVFEYSYCSIDRDILCYLSAYEFSSIFLSLSLHSHLKVFFSCFQYRILHEISIYVRAIPWTNQFETCLLYHVFVCACALLCVRLARLQEQKTEKSNDSTLIYLFYSFVNLFIVRGIKRWHRIISIGGKICTRYSTVDAIHWMARVIKMSFEFNVIIGT